MATPDDIGAGKRALIGPAIEHDVAMPLRIVMRGYFSTYFLWDAQHQAELARQMEAVHVGESRFSIEHRGYVLSSLVASAAFLETMVNELYRDAVDGHASYVAPLGGECLARMATLWEETNGGRTLEPLERYERLLEFAGAPPLDRGARPYQDAALVVRLRNAIIHYQPEDVSPTYEPHAFERSLRGRFPDNALMAGSGNPWWPDHALGYGCAVWAQRSVKALTEHVADALGLTPNYRSLEGREGFWQKPGARELDETT